MICERYLGIEFEKGWHDEIFYSLTSEKRNILVFIDPIGVASVSKSVSDLFTNKSHQ